MGKYSHPSVPEPPPPVVPEDITNEAKKKSKKKIRSGMSSRSTILTGPLGLTGEATTTKRTLLGG